MSQEQSVRAGGVTVDAHAHTVPAALLDDLVAGRERFPGVSVRPHESSHVVSFAGGEYTRPIAPGLLDCGARHDWLTDQGIDMQVVGGWLDMLGYQLDPDQGRDWAHTVSAHMAALADSRTVPLATVPLQAPEYAAAMLGEHRAAGFPGVMIGTRAGGRELDDPAYTPLWEAAHETRAAVFLHPGFGGASPRYADFGLMNGLARLEDTTVCVARLLYSGIPARYPGMRLVVAHAGAAVPYALGRLARNYALNSANLADPVESFAHLYFDSVVFDSDALRLLLAKAGAERILLGSDYPFPIGDLAPAGVVDSAGLDSPGRSAVMGSNAAGIFGITAGEGES